MNPTALMDQLCKSRPIFHSEADFQHAFAWQLRTTNNATRIRLETPVRTSAGREFHVDCIADIGRTRFYIELKYKSAIIKTTFQGEEFNLKEQSALMWARYDFCMDIHRLESLCDAPYKKGIAIILTNVPPLWKKSTRAKDSFDQQFRIHDGREVEGELSWSSGVSASVSKKRHKFSLLGKYEIQWRDYSAFAGEKKGCFRYCIVKVEPAAIRHSDPQE